MITRTTLFGNVPSSATDDVIEAELAAMEQEEQEQADEEEALDFAEHGPAIKSRRIKRQRVNLA